MADVFELLMIVCFGVSWPINIIKAWKARTTKGSSVQFYFLILVGYLFGITSKAIKLQHGISTPGYHGLERELKMVTKHIAVLPYEEQWKHDNWDLESL